MSPLPAAPAPAVPGSARRRQPPRLHGILPLAKPAGMTSFAAVREVRRLLGERRVGHAGTLDPMASGLLPICVGSATRLVDHFHQQAKRYHCGIRLGQRSDTLDLEGTLTPGADASAVSEAAVLAVLPRFVGEVLQVPPMHSAVRHDGRHLYELARQGLEVERPARTARIASIDLLGFTGGRLAEVELDVVCGKGTYMRVLAADLGEALGTGGVLAWLERTAYGELTLADAVSLAELAEGGDPAAALLPPEVAVSFLPRVDVGPQLALQVRRGQPVWLPRGAGGSGECRLHEAGGELVALGDLCGGRFRPTKVLAQGGVPPALPRPGADPARPATLVEAPAVASPGVGHGRP